MIYGGIHIANVSTSVREKRAYDERPRYIQGKKQFVDGENSLLMGKTICLCGKRKLLTCSSDNSSSSSNSDDDGDCPSREFGTTSAVIKAMLVKDNHRA